MRIETNQTFPAGGGVDHHIVEFKTERPLSEDEACNLFAALGFHSEQCFHFDAKMSHPVKAEISVNRGLLNNFLYVTGESTFAYLTKTFIDSLP